MSDGQQAPPQQMAKCVDCGKEMIVKTPSLRFVNFPEISLLVMAHTRPDVCGSCGAQYMPTMQGFLPSGGLNIQWKRIDVQQSAIVAPTAAEQAVVEKTRKGGLIVG